MWNPPTVKQLAKIPSLYSTEETPIADKIVKMHFFIGGSDWYIFEYDGEDLFFGYVILNGNTDMAEAGYISLSELKGIKVGFGLEVDRDMHWTPIKAGEIDKLKACMV